MSDQYVVIGNPVAHSKSPRIHSLFAAQTGQDLHYETLLAPLDGFASTVQQFRAQGGRGANVTVPFKQEAWQLASDLTERAARAEAVNTLCFDGDRIVGDNTDGAGLVNDISANLGVSLQGRSILLLGAGGAVRGVLQPVLACQPERLVIANRTAARAQELAQAFQGGDCAVSACALEQLQPGFDIIINGTSASLSAEVPPVPDALFASCALVYDMMYAPAGTVFMHHARERGAVRVSDGLGMLVEQAAEAFAVWRGVRPQTAPVLQLLRSEV